MLCRAARDDARGEILEVGIGDAVRDQRDARSFQVVGRRAEGAGRAGEARDLLRAAELDAVRRPES